jgi:hypothetical protein
MVVETSKNRHFLFILLRGLDFCQDDGLRASEAGEMFL